MSVCITSAGSASGIVYGGGGGPSSGMSISHMSLPPTMMEPLPTPITLQHPMPSPQITNSIPTLDVHSSHVHQHQSSLQHHHPPPPQNHHHHQPHSILHPQLSPVNLQHQSQQQQLPSVGDSSGQHPSPDMLLALIARNKALEASLTTAFLGEEHIDSQHSAASQLRFCATNKYMKRSKLDRSAETVASQSQTVVVESQILVAAGVNGMRICFIFKDTNVPADRNI